MTNYFFSIPILELSLLLVTIYLLPRHQSYGMIYLWLSVVIRHAINVAAFKRLLKTHLFGKEYSC